MARFILVHGSWQGAWCWREVLPLLEARGHEAVAIDLPGHGGDTAVPDHVTLQDYANRIAETVQTGEVHSILVVHSMGGAISQAAELVPDRVRSLVYIAALLPPNGSSMMQLVNDDPGFRAQLVWAPDCQTARISPEGAREFLYPRSPSATLESILPLLTPEPVVPLETPMQLTDANFGRVPRYYIECLRDRVVPIALQRSMRANFPFEGVCSLDADHCPFFSAPEELAAILDRISKEA